MLLLKRFFLWYDKSSVIFNSKKMKKIEKTEKKSKAKIVIILDWSFYGGFGSAISLLDLFRET